MSVSPIPAGAQLPIVAGSDGGSARSVQYPRVDEDMLARRIHERDFERRPDARSKNLMSFGGMTALGGLAGFAVVSKLFSSASSPASLAGKLGGAAIGALLLGAGGGWALSHQLTKMTPGRAREFAAKSLDADARNRPPLPPASAVPTERIGMPGVVRDGISGSTIGGIVQLKQHVVSEVSTQATTTRNDKGEPTIVIGNGSGQQVTTEQVVRTENASLNSVGLGRVLYDPEGYATMAEATQAYDGKHAAAVVKEGDRYLLVDVDAESWDAMQDRSHALSIADTDVKAVFANKGVYYPSSMTSGSGSQRLFLFAQKQDIDETIPTTVQELRGQPIGTYETNSTPKRNEFAPRYQVQVGDIHSGDEYSGPGFSSRAEAIQAMVQAEGQQGLVKSGERYYVADLSRTDGTGTAISIGDITDDTPDGAAILGLRTNDTSPRVQLIEDEGGLYAPVQDWWVRVNTAE